MTKLPLICSLLCLLLPVFSTSQSLLSQRSILLSIKQRWGNLPAMSTWMPTTSPCSWEEIHCSVITRDGNTAKSVTNIILENARIGSPILPSICNLTSLKTLDLGCNKIPGGFPTVLYSCSALTYVNLTGNLFVGPIPDDVGTLLPASLQYLDLSENNFKGNIPKSIGGLRELKTLNLAYNLSDGTYLSEISNLSKLEDLRLDLKPFYPMTLPSEWGNLKSLKFLSMEACNIVGHIPESVSGLVSLEHLELEENGLVGKIPDGLFLLKSLSVLTLYSNDLSGEIPRSVQTLHLSEIDLSQNTLNGSIPEDFGKLKRLRFLSLSYNSLSGEIPASIGLLPELQYLLVAYNKLSGHLPPELGLHSKTFRALEIYSNQLPGPLPENLCYSGSLTVIAASSNHLSGKIPKSLGSCLTLGNLEISDKLNLCSCSSSSASFLHEHLALVLLIAMIASSEVIYLIFFAIRKIKWWKHKDDLPTWKFTSFQRLEFTEANIISSLSEQNVIGSGGSGKVYRVQLDNSGYSVAVKRIWNNNHVNKAQFLAEVETLGNIRHINIVKLLCCISSEKTNLLVYQYLENQSLDRWLHRRRRLELERRGIPLHVLNWPTRLKIAIGAAQGLCYMHHDIVPPIIHRDIKSSNILLDSEFNAKIADFGLARMTVKQGQLRTMSSVAGTFGYLAPEYRQARKVNEKIDVYSFGVVLLELATGKEPNSRDETLNLADSSRKHLCEDKPIVDGLDMEVMQQNYLKQMTTVFKLGIMCTNPLPNSRPSMKEVLEVLRRSSPLEEAEDNRTNHAISIQ